MAITGAIFNSLIYGGVDSADYGVYVTGDAVFNAPKRSVELVSVPGRNGAIEIDQGHFENIEISYPAGMFGDDQTDFRERLSDFRNAIMSQKGYQRLSDTYHPDEFRMGIYVDGLEVEPKHYNEAGQFTLKFNCKPQRFLTSGEEVITIGEWEDYETVTGDKVSFEADDTTKIKDIKTDINPRQAGTPTRNTETGSIVSFDAISATRIHNVSADINPVQDLHGYEYPWVGGAGKNKLDFKARLDGWGATYTESDGTYTVTNAGSGYRSPYTFSSTDITVSARAIVTNLTGASNWRIDFLASDDTLVSSITSARSVVQGITANKLRLNYGEAGNGATFKDIQLEFSATATTFEPYENICPITGFDDVNVYRAGFNVWDEEWEVGGINATTGQNATNNTAVRSKNYIPIKNVPYYFKQASSGSQIFLYGYDKEKNYVGAYSAVREAFIIGGSLVDIKNSVITIPENAKYIRIRSDANYGATYKNDMSVNYPATDHDYHAYNGNTYNIDLSIAGTVYGGTLDATARKLIVDRKRISITSETTLYVSSSSSYGAFASVGLSGTSDEGKRSDNEIMAISDSCRGIPFANRVESATDSQPRCYINDNGNLVMRFPNTITTATASDFHTAFDGSNFVYYLKTPLEYDLTPQQITALVGENNVWADTGNVTVDYGNVYPIGGYFTIKLYHSPTPDSEDATEYEISTGTAGRMFGGELDVTAGKITKTDEMIVYYMGQTLPSTWISDRDQYAPGTTPSIGAQVVYKLASPEEYDVTATQIEALIGSNYIWSNSGDVTVEYGWNPNLLVNPTLFDARPLLMVEGYGNIEMNGKDIELKRVLIGNVSIAGSETKQFGTSTTMEIGFNPEQFNTGDAISVNPLVFASDDYYELHGDELTLYTATDQLQGAQTTFRKEGTSNYKIQTAWPALTFYVGTDAEYTNEAIITGEAGGQGFLNQRLRTKVELSHRSNTDAVIKFTFTSLSMYEDLYVIAVEKKLILNGINGDSTLLTLGHPTYIDCNLGEAYMIKNGTAISLNAYIDLGSDLPSLGPGLNRIDFDDTITELKLRPDWWKV